MGVGLWRMPLRLAACGPLVPGRLHHTRAAATGECEPHQSGGACRAAGVGCAGRTGRSGQDRAAKNLPFRANHLAGPASIEMSATGTATPADPEPVNRASHDPEPRHPSDQSDAPACSRQPCGVYAAGLSPALVTPHPSRVSSLQGQVSRDAWPFLLAGRHECDVRLRVRSPVSHTGQAGSTPARRTGRH